MTAEDELAAVEAERLRTDPAFQAAVKEARRAALEALVSADPTKPEQIMIHQANIRAIDQVCTAIANAIIRGTPQRKNPSV